MDVKKEFPAQAKNRAQWVVDTVRENQERVFVLFGLIFDGDYKGARLELSTMHKGDRDAILVEGGILTKEQLIAIKEGDA